MDVDVARDLQADALAPVSRGAEDQFGGDDPVLEDQTVVIDVVNEEVERADPLFEPALDPVPFGRSDQPGDRVERDDPLDPLIAAVDRERDSLLPSSQIRELVAPLEFREPQGRETFMERR